MRIEIKNFGAAEVEEKDIFTFQQPIFGFEHLQRFALLEHEEFGGAIRWLQSMEDPQICFVLVDPVVLPEKYEPCIPSQLMQQLNVQDCDHLECWVLAVITQDFKKSTVNLKSPVLFCATSKLGAQIILEQDYPIRCPIFEQRQGE